MDENNDEIEPVTPPGLDMAERNAGNAPGGDPGADAADEAEDEAGGREEGGATMRLGVFLRSDISVFKNPKNMRKSVESYFRETEELPAILPFRQGGGAEAELNTVKLDREHIKQSYLAEHEPMFDGQTKTFGIGIKYKHGIIINNDADMAAVVCEMAAAVCLAENSGGK